MVDGGEVKWLGLAVKAVNEGERAEGLVLEREGHGTEREERMKMKKKERESEGEQM